MKTSKVMSPPFHLSTPIGQTDLSLIENGFIVILTKPSSIRPDFREFRRKSSTALTADLTATLVFLSVWGAIPSAYADGYTFTTIQAFATPPYVASIAGISNNGTLSGNRFDSNAHANYGLVYSSILQLYNTIDGYGTEVVGERALLSHLSPTQSYLICCLVANYFSSIARFLAHAAAISASRTLRELADSTTN